MPTRVRSGGAAGDPPRAGGICSFRSECGRVVHRFRVPCAVWSVVRWAAREGRPQSVEVERVEHTDT